MSSSLRVVSKRSTWGKWFAGFSTDCCCCCCCVCCCSWAVPCCCFPKNGMGITTSVVERGYGNWRISNRDVLIWFIFDISQCPVTHTRFFHISFPISFLFFFFLSSSPRLTVHTMALPGTETIRFRRPTTGPNAVEQKKEPKKDEFGSLAPIGWKRRHQSLLQDQLKRCVQMSLMCTTIRILMGLLLSAYEKKGISKAHSFPRYP